MGATYQELQATLCCWRGGKCRKPQHEECSAWCYDVDAEHVLDLLDIDLPGRKLIQGERP